MKKIVHYIPALVNGGIESMLLNYYTYLNKEFKFVIIVHGDIELNCKNKFEKLNAKIYQIPHWKDNFILHSLELFKILKKENPDIFHSHHGIYNFIPSFVAMIACIKIRISHCHSFFEKKSFKERIYSFFSYIFSNYYIGCGKGALNYLIGNHTNRNSCILYNSIDVKNFEFKSSIRFKIRNKLDWNNFVIYGNVGRFCEQKNQMFLIDIYEKIYKLNKNSRFLIIGGSGSKYDDIVNKVNNSSIKDVCLILKDIQNVNEYYLAMDYFLLPSLFEGFAVSVIEAQISNLPCILSPTITKEFESDSIYFADSIIDVNDWIKCINKIKNINRKKKFNNYDVFDVSISYVNLKKIYNDLMEG